MLTKILTRWSIAAALIVSGATWGAWQWCQERYPTWQEEVQLSDGRIIVVKQKHEVYENYGTNQSWVTFSLPEMGGDRTWHSYLMPMRVDLHEGKVYVFGRPRGDRQVQYYGYPRHYMVAFKWTATGFERVPFMELPPELRASENILPCVPPNRKDVLSWSSKRSSWCPASDMKGLMVRTINLDAYEQLARDYARRDGATSVTN